MNPNAPQPNFELPTPQPVPAAESINAAPEQAAARPETQIQPGTAPINPLPVGAPLQPPLPMQAPSGPKSPTSQLPATNSPAIADDSDLIEKEWVIKAKQIVAATREDPHLQNKEMSKFKADYLKKRYNKDIKIEES